MPAKKNEENGGIVDYFIPILRYRILINKIGNDQGLL
jgi:hypothetical protein